MSIKNVTLAGASGTLGGPVYQRLVAADDLTLSVLRRHGSKTTFPPNVNVLDVDFDSVEDLTSALAGQDAVVSTFSPEQITAQKNLAEAAVAAGVKRFIPSDFCPDLANENTKRLPVFLSKVEMENVLTAKAKTTNLTYTFLYNGVFLDWGLLDPAGDKTQLVDGGDTIFSATTLASVANAVYGILKHPEETKNRAVYVEDAKISQNKVLELAKRAAPEKPWGVKHVRLDELTDEADKKLAEGVFDYPSIMAYLYRSIIGADNGGSFEKNDNELLGLKGKTEEELFEIVKTFLK
jgi:uncharacterized protein YbjT (DUF2867 family)